jgi:hypothetical protein
MMPLEASLFQKGNISVGGPVVLLDEARIFLILISISNQNIGKWHITLNQYGY